MMKVPIKNDGRGRIFRRYFRYCSLLAFFLKIPLPLDEHSMPINFIKGTI